MDKQIREHDGVVLVRDRPADNLVAGHHGVAVYVHQGGKAFEVEFSNPSGEPRFVVITIEADDLLKLQPRARLKDAS